MTTLFHMIILAFVFYFVLKHDLKLHHKKALTRGILLAVVAGLVGFFIRGVRLEGFQEGAEGEDDDEEEKPDDTAGALEKEQADEGADDDDDGFRNFFR